ncbi:MAG: helix-turn-helix domain-containing protein [Eubacteriales bacterium]
MLDDLPEILTLKECQIALNIGKNLMLNLIKTGKIPAFRVGNRWRINKKNLREFTDTCCSGSSPQFV